MSESSVVEPNVTESNEIESSNFETSPYLEGSTDFTPEPVESHNKEQFYTEQETNRISKMFENRSNHMKYLFKLYKFIAPAAKQRKKAIYEKTEAEVLEDVMNTKGYSLDMDSLAGNVASEIEESMRSNELFHKQIECIPLFIDFAYMYYIRNFCDDTPVLKLPTFLPKFKLIMSMLKVPHDDLYGYFEHCIENEIIKEMRQEIPPFHLRTDLTEIEIRDKMKLLVLPMFKNILKGLLEMGGTKKIAIRPDNGARSDSITIPINHNSREDNLQTEDPQVQDTQYIQARDVQVLEVSSE